MKINIIGKGRGARQGLQANGLRWTVNRWLPGSDLMFDMHITDRSERQTKLRDQATEAGCPVMDLETYPIGRMRNQFNTEYFSNSICYMLAYAISRMPAEIDLYGCHINTQPGDTEIICKNHPGAEFWLGVAMGRGVKVKIHGDSFLLRCKGGMYGYRDKKAD